jgi:hypothetical protein
MPVEGYKCRNKEAFIDVVYVSNNNLFFFFLLNDATWDSSVGVAACYWLDGRGLIPGMGKNFFFSERPDRLWGPTSFLLKEYRGFFPRR